MPIVEPTPSHHRAAQRVAYAALLAMGGAAQLRAQPVRTCDSDRHSGAEFDGDSRTWRGYIEDNKYTQKHLAEATFADREAAAVAASDLLTRVREDTPPADAKTSGLPRL